jgi:hypothetical protein
MRHTLTNEANFIEYVDLGADVRANMCALDPLEVKCEGVSGVGGVADKEAYILSVLYTLFPSSITLQLAVSFPVLVMCSHYAVYACFSRAYKLLT